MNIIPSIARVSDNKQIFGSLNIGKLQETNIIHIKRKPCFLNEKNELVYCESWMKDKIEQRLTIIQN